MFAKSKLILLRMCNEVLRRLSKASNTEFCGRVLVFLARAFPLSERSAVNVKSLYNTGNSTEFEELEAEDGAESKTAAEAGGDLKLNVDTSSDSPVDSNFYNTFWSLQKHFADPTTLYQTEAWDEFITASNTVVASLEAHWHSSEKAKTLTVNRKTPTLTLTLTR